MQTLSELRHEYDVVTADVTHLNEQLAAREAHRRDVLGAIEALARLTNRDSAAAEDGPVAEADEDERIPDVPLVQGDSPIAKYVKRGGQGSRLSSTSMIVDVLEEFDKPTNRDQLKEAFFKKFSRAEMERFWDRPDNAFSTALARAAEGKLIARRTRKDGTEVYASLAVLQRINNELHAAASSNPEVEEER